MDVAFPFHFDPSGRTANSGPASHLRELIEQVLFTSPGERVMQPEFGSGLLGLVFEQNSSTLAATTQMLAHSALQHHLGHLIAVQAVDVNVEDATLQVEVRYVVLRDRTTHSATFTRSGSGG